MYKAPTLPHRCCCFKPFLWAWTDCNWNLPHPCVSFVASVGAWCWGNLHSYHSYSKSYILPIFSVLKYNIRSWPHQDKRLVTFILQLRAIQPLQKKSVQQDDVIQRMAVKHQTMENHVEKQDGNIAFVFFHVLIWGTIQSLHWSTHIFSLMSAASFLYSVLSIQWSRK